jgi:hypothetical protein
VKLGVKRTAFLSVVTMVICLFPVLLAFGQAAPAPNATAASTKPGGGAEGRRCQAVWCDERKSLC